MHGATRHLCLGVDPSFWIVGINVVEKKYQEKQSHPQDVAEHRKLYVRDHLNVFIIGYLVSEFSI